MSITPEHFLTFAEQAVSDSKASEFDFRNAASRAYYSAFHCCLSQRSRCPELSEQEISGSHDRLYKRFELLGTAEPSNLTVKKMAYLARMMKSVRHHADYRLGSDFSKDDALQQIADAKTVVKNWKTLR